MQGDFSRWTFNPDNPFTRVLMQQGRVQLDADWNEQVASLLYFMRTLAADMMGPHGTWNKETFKVELDGTNFTVNEAGRYYVNGLLCDAKSGREINIELSDKQSQLVYLDVWEQHLTHLEQDTRHNPTQPGIREVALNGVDTATRSKIVWQIKTTPTNTDSKFSELQSKYKELKKNNNELAKLKQQLRQKENQLNSNKDLNEEFQAFKFIFEKLEEIVEPPTDELKFTPSAVAYNNNDLIEIIKKLNGVIKKLKKTDSIPLDDDNSDQDQRISNMLTQLNIIKHIFKHKSDIQKTKEKIKLCKKNITDIKPEGYKISTGTLKAQVSTDASPLPTDPCTIPPEAQYRGMENQLYRVEIHQGGSKDEATFKWSRENGSVIFAIEELPSPSLGETEVTATVNLTNLGPDDRLTLAKDDWVEIVDDDYSLQLKTEPLWQVTAVDPTNLKVTLKRARNEDETIPTTGQNRDKHPLLRRWDQGRDVITVKENEWIDLENDLQIQFDTGNYLPGDYWLIPARTVTGQIEWPKDDENNPKAVPPHGIEHHYAPLAIINPKNNEIIDLRRLFTPLGQPIGD